MPPGKLSPSGVRVAMIRTGVVLDKEGGSFGETFASFPVFHGRPCRAMRVEINIMRTLDGPSQAKTVDQLN